jgi:hypothetical protein
MLVFDHFGKNFAADFVLGRSLELNWQRWLTPMRDQPNAAPASHRAKNEADPNQPTCRLMSFHLR